MGGLTLYLLINLKKWKRRFLKRIQYTNGNFGNPSIFRQELRIILGGQWRTWQTNIRHQFEHLISNNVTSNVNFT